MQAAVPLYRLRYNAHNFELTKAANCMVVKDIDIGVEGFGFDFCVRQVGHCRQRLSTAATFRQGLEIHLMNPFGGNSLL